MTTIKDVNLTDTNVAVPEVPKTGLTEIGSTQDWSKGESTTRYIVTASLLTPSPIRVTLVRRAKPGAARANMSVRVAVPYTVTTPSGVAKEELVDAVISLTGNAAVLSGNVNDAVSIMALAFAMMATSEAGDALSPVTLQRLLAGAIKF